MRKYHGSKTNGAGWSVLAAAIIASGRKENDKAFLQSDWCANLEELIRLSQLNNSVAASLATRMIGRGVTDDRN